MKVVFTLLIAFGLMAQAWAGSPKTHTIKTTGTVRHQGLEGGFWGIVGDDEKNYDPVNLAPEFQQEGLKVSFEAVPAASQASIHMWGTLVELKSIKREGSSGAGMATDSVKPITGIARANLQTTWKAAEKVLTARGDSLVLSDETTASLTTKPHDLDRATLLASMKSSIKPEDSGYRYGTYQLAIYLTEKSKQRTFVEVKARIMAFGCVNKAMAKPDTWDPVLSNGKIEIAVLKAILAEARKMKN
jgi:hypothetical protein